MTIFAKHLKNNLILKVALVFFTSSVAQAATYYIAPSGSDTSPGTLSSPFATLNKAITVAVAGDTLFLRGGVYVMKSAVNFQKSGASGNPIKVFNYPGEVPILDASGISTSGVYPVRFYGGGNYWHIKGLELKNGPEGGITIGDTAHDITIENCNVHHNGRLSQYGGQGISVFGSASNVLLLNNDSHHNFDAGSNGPGEDADGFEIGSRGSGIILRGNRSWRNGDDGYDTWGAAPLVFDGNVAFENALNDSLQRSGSGDGNGFKLGGNFSGGSSGGHMVRRNIAFKNPGNGFDENSATNALTLYNNVTYANGRNLSFYDRPNIFRNNISLQGTISAAGDTQYNSWTLPVTVSTADFVTMSETAIRGPRNADGTINHGGFLNLTAGSDLIDRGVNVGLSFSGSAPDLGVFEFGGSTAPSTTTTTLPSVTTTTTLPPATTTTTTTLPPSSTNLVATNDATNVTYKYVFSGTPSFLRLYLDTDRSASTGYPFNGIGANYLIENSTLYRYSGTNGSWSWTAVSSSQMVKSTSSVTWTVARSSLGSPSAINLVATTNLGGTTGIVTQVLSTSMTWTRCAVEGETCVFSGTRQVRYGANGTYAYQTATGSLACTNAVFGDPVYGVQKFCDYSN